MLARVPVLAGSARGRDSGRRCRIIRCYSPNRDGYGFLLQIRMSWLRAFERVSALVLVLWSTNQRPPTNCHQPTATNQLPTPTPWCSLLCKGSDVRPGVLWSPWLLRGRRSTWYSARGRMYALASLCRRQHQPTPTTNQPPPTNQPTTKQPPTNHRQPPTTNHQP